MKRFIPCVFALALGLALAAGNTATPQAARAHELAVRSLDDPPPEPVTCPMCGGNAQVHARRLIAIQEHINRVALLATRW
jgi:hypothetical protein